MTKPCYVFPHVPKCGGTSLRRHLELSGLNVLIDYDLWDTEPTTAEIAALRRTQDTSQYDIIFGHFPVERYVGPQFRYIALVRDPLERCMSSYLFHRDMRTDPVIGSDIFNRIGHWIARGELSFLEYLNVAPDMKRVYAHFLNYWPAERFDLIGATNNYGAFLEHLSALFGIRMENNIHERKQDHKISLTENERVRAMTLLNNEYIWFNSFVQHANCAASK